VKEVTDATFEADVLQAGTPVVVDFWAPWCGPCRAVTPILEQLAEEHSGIAFTKVNIDDNPRIAADYNIMSIPTMSVFSGGQVVKTVVGLRPKAALLRELADYIA